IRPTLAVFVHYRFDAVLSGRIVRHAIVTPTHRVVERQSPRDRAFRTACGMTPVLAVVLLEQTRGTEHVIRHVNRFAPRCFRHALRDEREPPELRLERTARNAQTHLIRERDPEIRKDVRMPERP